MLIENIEEEAGEYGAIWHKELSNGERALIVPLLYHAAVYIYPAQSDCMKDRFCLVNPELARKAITEYEETGLMRYWQKHHNQGISIVGNKAYPSGMQETDDNIQYEVDWNMEELEIQYESFIHSRVSQL